MSDEVAWALDLQDEALGMMAFFPLALMVRAPRSTGEILLTGDGGDEVFSVTACPPTGPRLIGKRPSRPPEIPILPAARRSG